MGPVTIAVDSFGPVTDNAQSVYELSQIEGIRISKKKSKQNLALSRILKMRNTNSKKRWRWEYV